MGTFRAVKDDTPKPAARARVLANLDVDDLAVDRIGDALAVFDQALRSAPQSLVVHLSRVEALLQVGRLPFAMRQSAIAFE